MKKAFITVVVDSATVKEVVEHIRELDCGDTQLMVLADGDISITEKDISTLPNEVWLCEEEGGSTLALVEDGSRIEGRTLTLDELTALQNFGVCVELKANHPSASKYGTPVYAIYDEAAMAVASSFGFDVLDVTTFKTDFQDTGDDSAEQRWLRIRTPAWLNLAATLRTCTPAYLNLTATL